MREEENIVENGIDISQEETLQHYGTSLASGRYKLGSGDAAYQRNVNFRSRVDYLRSKGLHDNEIARDMEMNSTEFRARLSESKSEITRHNKLIAQNMRRNGKSLQAISERLYGDKSHESTVRNLLKDSNTKQQLIFDSTKKALKDELEKTGYLDVGLGSELYLGITQDKLGKVLKSLETEGYKVHPYIQVEQYGTDDATQKTTVKVLTKGDVSDRDIYEHLEEIRPPFCYSEDGGKSFRKIEPPVMIDQKRIYIKYAEDGGLSKDGTIEIRPGVEDLSLGKAHYAQVRIGVEGNLYLKGMALYSDNIPPGYDIVFNTNKHGGTPIEKVLKGMKEDPVEGNSPSKVFGASIKGEDQLILAKQRHYIDANGEEKLSAINIVNEEGSWNEWSHNLSAQMLSKQPHALAKQQLDLTYQMKREQLNDILSLTNPTVKKKLLEGFADGCDSDAVHMQAYGFPNQTTKVILPVDSMPDNEIYCPSLPNGTRVVLIRYPHSSIHEIPSLVVNNNRPEAKKILGNAIDAVGINSHVSQHLSGADFDGDTVLVIPNNDGRIKAKPQYKELENIDLEAKYPKYDGMKVMTEKQKQRKMGEVTNLISDMTGAGATDEEMVRAIRHSMVVIDAVKHELDWKRSEKENCILELKRKYQLKDDGTMGAGTLITRAKSPVYERREKGYYKIDPESGKKIWVVTDPNKKRTIITTQMANTEDARDLISSRNSPIERVYADYANKMKAMALEARKEAVATPRLQRDPEAASLYADEVTSLNAKLRNAKKNKPLERQAQILANVSVKQYINDNPSIENEPGQLKKLKGRTLQEKRMVTGANKQKVTFTENEWKAVQAGAVSDSFLSQLLQNADDAHVKQLSMPREKSILSSSRKTQIEQLLNKGYSIAQVAEMKDVPVSQVTKISAEMR